MQQTIVPRLALSARLAFPFCPAFVSEKPNVRFLAIDDLRNDLGARVTEAVNAHQAGVVPGTPQWP
jgi:hypothetical protein